MRPTLFNGLRLYVFVHPEFPGTDKWYLQFNAATIGNLGNWTQFQVFVGNDATPANTGDAIEVRAVLVNSDATYNGINLVNLPLDSAQVIIEDIEGIISISDPISLTVRR